MNEQRPSGRKMQNDSNLQKSEDISKMKFTDQVKPPEQPETTQKPVSTQQSDSSSERVRKDKRIYRRYGHKRYQKPDQVQTTNLNNKIISIVIPLYNEEESLVELSINLRRVLEKMRANYEVIFIDDGSTDNSFLKIKEISQLNGKFKCIKFNRNYGKSAALAEGFKTAKGDYIVTMDADLQDDPEEIPVLIQKLNEGFDLVSGWKKKRYDPFIKKNSSKLFNFVTGMLVGLKLHDYNCGLKAYRSEVVNNIKIYGEMHRYIPAIAHLSGYKVTEIAVTHHPRKFGKTKFGASRFLNGLFDLITVLFTAKFIKRPLHFFGSLGLLSFLSGSGIIIYLTVLKFFEEIPISNRPLFLAGILLAIVGAQFFSLGLIGEMITKTSSDKEHVIIEKTLNY